jgi:cytochrome c peroxidase
MTARYSALRTSCILVVVALVAAFGYFSSVRAEVPSRGGRVIPLRPVAALSTVPIPPVYGIEGIIADKSAAIQLGKALFWDMQAGSDDIQSCASCHFNAGADSRPNNQINPGQAGGDNTFQVVPGPNNQVKAGSADAGVGGYHDGDYPFHKLADVNDAASIVSDVNDVTGSQGVFSTKLGQVFIPSPPASLTPTPTEQSDSDDAGFIQGPGRGPRIPVRRRPPPRKTPSPVNPAAAATMDSVETTTPNPDAVFSYPDPTDPTQRIGTRRTTARNAPSVVDAAYNNRNFWDGRAQNMCNGANPFGARDTEAHLVSAETPAGPIAPTFLAMENSSLCSQALGPAVNPVEMSAAGRNFHDLGRKLLARRPLQKQIVDPKDSVLGPLSGFPRRGLTTSYAALIQAAFAPEWWQFNQHICLAADGSKSTADPARAQTCPSSTQEYTQMEFNFSLFWGVAIQMYESTLIADQTPFDQYLAQQQTYTLTTDALNNSYTIQLAAGVDPYTVSITSLNPMLDASDQDVFSFDDGKGQIVGFGVTSGTINYFTGTLSLVFDAPPVASVPVIIKYSTGPTPMTGGQLHGMILFESKARCIVCHGGPELSNAAVGTVSQEPYERMIMANFTVKIYDTGYYHIGVRPGQEDAGLGGVDGVAGQPLSQSELLRQRVCNDPSITIMIPGRPGDGITNAPLSCYDDIAQTATFKAPQLRNVALTAPYFHNGSQLTLEQVVEFYDRGGDFSFGGTELTLMDPNVQPLGLTAQEQTDLVDFLRNGLTDARTAIQAAPFDHPELFVANGSPAGLDGFPVQKDPAHPGQARDQMMRVPATGKNGGKPLPTFLENLLAASAR